MDSAKSNSFVVWLGKTGFYVLLLTLFLSCQSLLVSYSKKSGPGGQYSYNTTSTILLAEVVKFIISSSILVYGGQGLGFRLNRETLLYSLPALIYFVQNNLVFWALLYIDATTYQVLVNLKILTTGVLFRFIMGKELSGIQWSALVLLMVGCATSQISTDCDAGSIFAVPIQGIIIVVILSVLSASAGIITEWIMKKSSLKMDPLHRQNLHLYFFGIIFNTLGYMMEKQPTESFFAGYNAITWSVVMSYSFTGLCVSVIMKYADNMVKIYAVAVSMALTMILSIFMFEYEPTTQLFFGIVIITISILMYFNVVSSEISSPSSSSSSSDKGASSSASTASSAPSSTQEKEENQIDQSDVETGGIKEK